MMRALIPSTEESRVEWKVPSVVMMDWENEARPTGRRAVVGDGIVDESHVD
jgi:hypothetical protein